MYIKLTYLSPFTGDIGFFSGTEAPPVPIFNALSIVAVIAPKGPPTTLEIRTYINKDFGNFKLSISLKKFNNFQHTNL